MKVPLKGAVIGLGRMGITHYATLNTHPDVEFAAGCDSSDLILKNLGRYSSLALYKDVQKMLDEIRLDFVVVATPTASHFAFIKMAIDRGVHVFTEKPFVLNPPDGEMLVELVEAKNVVNQVGYFLRSDKVFQTVKRILDCGLIGNVLHYKNETYGKTVMKSSQSSWRGKKEMGGGCMLDFASHCIDLAHYLFGPVDSVNGSTLRKIYSKNVEDAAFTTLHHKTGIGGHILANWSDSSYRRPFNRIEIYGSTGRIIADRQEYRLFLKGTPGNSEYKKGWNLRYLSEIEEPVRFNIRGNSYVSQLDKFVECVKNENVDTPCTFAEALETDRVIEMIRADAEKRTN